jgi:DNA-binding NarL/FixJ family response regulator
LASVLVGDFGAVMRLGLIGVLGDADIACVAEPDHDARRRGLLQRLDDVHPDAVVVDWDDRRYEAVTASVLARHPEVTVIACSSNRLSLRVVPGQRDRGPYESKLSAQGLVEAVQAAFAR